MAEPAEQTEREKQYPLHEFRWPLPVDKVLAALEGAKRLIAVEQNYTGQLATLIRAYTGVKADALINRYDGRPMSPEYILARFKEVA